MSVELLDPQLITKQKVAVNTSTSKQMYSFGRRQRFKEYSKTNENFFYNLPSVFDEKARQQYRKGMGIGYGTKSDFTKGINKGKADKFYDIPREFELHRHRSPQYSFGQGRDVCKRPETVGKGNNPGPGTYNVRKEFGADATKFSLFGRTWVKGDGVKKSIYPGPGQYAYLGINKSGRYPTSVFENSRQSTFLRTPRFNYNYNKNPSPDRYKSGELNKNYKGELFVSKYASNVAKTMSSRPRDFFQPKLSTTPGPGSYDFFSDFAGFSRLRTEPNKTTSKNKSKIQTTKSTHSKTESRDFGNTKESAQKSKKQSAQKSKTPSEHHSEKKISEHQSAKKESEHQSAKLKEDTVNKVEPEEKKVEVEENNNRSINESVKIEEEVH